MSRPRTSHACRDCRRKKLRCDLARPLCSRCAASANSTCVYDGAVIGNRDFHFVQTTFSADQSQSSANNAGSTKDVALSTNRLQTLEDRLERLTAQVQVLQGRSSTESTVLAPSEQHEDEAQDSTKRVRTTASAASAEAMQVSGTGHLLNQPGGRLRYISNGHWAAMCEEASEIETLLRGQTRYDVVDSKQPMPRYYGTMMSAPPAWNSSHRMSSKFRQPSPLHTLRIPDRSRSDALFEAYVSCFHPVVALTHIPTLRREYELFWDLQLSNEARDRLQNLPLILAALYAGAVVCSHPSLQVTLPDIDVVRMSTEIYHEGTDCLHRAHFPRAPTVATLTAYLILQGTWLRDEEPLTTCSFTGVAVRVAQMLGLHKDPSHFKATIAPVQAEVQRRVWWHVYHLDALVAMASGLPPLIECKSWDTKMVSTLYEDKFGTVEGIQHDDAVRAGHLKRVDSPEFSSLVSPLGLWLQSKCEETLLVRKLLDQAFHENQMTVNDLMSARDDLLLLRREMRERSRHIPLATSQNTYENNVQFNMWTKVMLPTLGDKNWWFLHTPLLHRSITQAWRDLIPNLQLYCCAFLEQYNILCCAQDFVRFQWAWPGNHQPLHALMLMLKELERNPTSADAEISCNTVDQTMALCLPEGGITAGGEGATVQRPLTEGGGEAWDFIRRLRSRVWTKLGHDPDVMLTRGDVSTFVAEKMQHFKSSGGNLDLRTPLPRDITGQLEEIRAQSATTTHAARTSMNSSPLQRTDAGQTHFDHYTFGQGGVPTPNINWEDWDQIFNTGQD